MPGINRVTLLGNLGSDPELRQTEGAAVCSFALITDVKYKSHTGELKVDKQMTRISVFGKYAAACNQYLSKGKRVYIEGRLHNRSWMENGVKRSTAEVIASEVIFLDKSTGQSPYFNADEIEQQNPFD